MKGLSTAGIGTLLLVLWRFFPLPYVWDQIAWNAACGALTIGSAVAVAEHSPQTKEQRFRIVLAGICLLSINWFTGNGFFTTEDIAGNVGIVLVAAALLAGRRWPLLLGTIAVTVLGELLLLAIPITSTSPWPWLLMGILGLLTIRFHPLWLMLPGSAGCVIGWWQLSNMGVPFMSNEQLGSFTVTANALAAGAGLILLGLLRMLPEWRPLGSLGLSATTVYVLTYLAARIFGEEQSSSFGWTMYSPLSDAIDFPETQPWGAQLTNTITWTNSLAGCIAVALCIFFMWRRRMGLAERSFEQLYQRL